MNVGRNLTAVFAGDEVWNPLHRAGPIERDERHDVHEAGGLELRADALHPLGLELEHAERLATADHLVGLGVVIRDGRDVELGVDRAPDLVHRSLHHGEVAQAEEVHLQQADALDDVHVVLRVDAIVADLHQRHVVGQRILRDDDACGVGRGVACQPFDRRCGVEQLSNLGVVIVQYAQLRNLLESLRDRQPRRAGRDQLCDAIDVG